MKLKHKLVLIIGIVVILVFFGFFLNAQTSGGPLCGPVCPPEGPHYWKKECLGIETRQDYIDSYAEKCFGLLVGEKSCYEIVWEESDRSEHQVPCQ